MNAARPGQWPEGTRPGPLPVEGHAVAHDEQGEQHLALVRVQARFHVTLGAVRADLEEQPSDRSIRAAAKRWQDAITAVAEELITQRRRGG